MAVRQITEKKVSVFTLPGVALLVTFVMVFLLSAAKAEGAEGLPYYLADRGEGLPTSQFGTYVRKGELLIYPFYEYTYNSGEEYKPSEVGFIGEKDYLGTAKEHEVLLFLSYGFTDWLAVELEGAPYTKVTLEKADDDTSAMPESIEESGVGDLEGQIRWRWNRETAGRPEIFSFFEVGFPLAKDKDLIGNADWEFVFGLGIVKGFHWGTITPRISVLYEREEDELKFGEYAIEYLKRISPKWRLVANVEGEEDEVSLIGEAQYFVKENIFLKLNSGFGLTEKAANFAPEVGIMFSF